MADRARPAPAVAGLSILGLLGAGAHSRVWEAVDTASGDRVAVKVPLRPGEADVAGGVDAAMAREAALHSRIEHPHVVRVRRVLDLPDGGRALVLDLAAGGSLSALLARRHSLSAAEVVALVLPLAQALADLHERGLVHGDVAPANVLLTGDGRPVLCDLGAGRSLGEARPTAAHGHDGFVAPEVIAGGSVSPASDVFSLATVGLRALGVGLAGGVGPTASAEQLAVFEVLSEAVEREVLRRPTAAELASRLRSAAVPVVPIDLQEESCVLPEATCPSGPTARRGRPLAAANPVGPHAVDRLAGDITRRIRVAALEAEAEAAAARGGRPERARPAGAPGRRGRRRGSAMASAVLPGSRRLLGWAGAIAAVVVLVAALTILRSAPDRQASQPGPQHAAVAATAAGVATPPVEALADLAVRRAQAVMRRDMAGLRAVAEPGSPAEAADTALITRLRGSGVRLDGVRYDVRDARLLRWAGSSAVVGATITTARHLQVADAGATRSVPQGRPEIVEVTLVPAAQDPGWLIREVRPG